MESRTYTPNGTKKMFFLATVVAKVGPGGADIAFHTSPGRNLRDVRFRPRAALRHIICNRLFLTGLELVGRRGAHHGMAKIEV